MRAPFIPHRLHVWESAPFIVERSHRVCALFKVKMLLGRLEFNISKNSIRIMTVDQFDSNVLKEIEATDLEDIGIPSLGAHMIVNSAKAKFLGIHSRSPPIP